MNNTELSIQNMQYKKLTAEELIRLSSMFSIRPNKSCDSAPLVSMVYESNYVMKFCEIGDALLTSYNNDADDEIFGFIPYCHEEELPFYFKLQEEYFNKVLKRPLIIYSAEHEGVTYLRNHGLLDNYEIIESEDMKDYLYDAESLRTLAGRKYSKKRNHLNKFHTEYDGRWEYRRIVPEDLDEIKDFLAAWLSVKINDHSEEGNAVNEEGNSYYALESLNDEAHGILNIITHPVLFDYIKIGGIWIDGKLEAFSIGDYNPAEKMAIIDIEKANPDIVGLYQIINQQFLIHEYPDAILVNREDDCGMEGLRQAKLTYYPIDFERKYVLKQKTLS